MRAILKAFNGKLGGEIYVQELKPVLYLPVPERPRFYNYTEIEHEIPGSRVGFKKAAFRMKKRVNKETAIYEMECIES